MWLSSISPPPIMALVLSYIFLWKLKYGLFPPLEALEVQGIFPFFT